MKKSEQCIVLYMHIHILKTGKIIYIYRNFSKFFWSVLIRKVLNDVESERLDN